MMTGDVWVFTEQRNGRLLEVSFELLGGGRKIAEKLNVSLVAVMFGFNVENLAKELISYGADKVYLVENPALNVYQHDVYAKVLTDLAVKHKPEVLLLGATSVGRDLAPRVAAKLKTGLCAHITDLVVGEDGILRQVVPGFGGNVMAVVTCPKTKPQMATVRPGVFRKLEKDENRKGEIEKVSVDVDLEKLPIVTLKMVEEPPKEKPIEQAEVIVAAGWGVRSKESFKLVQELANVLGAGLGGTRPILDEGLIHESQMIGQSGKIVRPKLYVGVGVSGEMHHTIGILNSDIIVAINNDPNAPIFEFVDIGIVGDANEVLPILIEKLRKKEKF